MRSMLPFTWAVWRSLVKQFCSPYTSLSCSPGWCSLAEAELCALLPSQTSALQDVFVCACPSNAGAGGFLLPPCPSLGCWGTATPASSPALSIRGPDGTDKPWGGPGRGHLGAVFTFPLWAAKWGMAQLPSGAGAGSESEARQRRRLQGTALCCRGQRRWPWHMSAQQRRAGTGASCSSLLARGYTSGVTSLWTAKQVVPSLEGVIEQIHPPRALGQPGRVCRCQGVNRHFAISARRPKHGNKS